MLFLAITNLLNSSQTQLPWLLVDAYNHINRSVPTPEKTDRLHSIINT